MDTTNSGYTIRELRDREGIGAKELASKLNVSESDVQSWERGDTAPTATQLNSLATTFGVTTTEIRVAGASP